MTHVDARLGRRRFRRTRVAAMATILACSVAAHARDDKPGSITYDPAPGPGAGRHIVLLAGDEEYRSEEGLPMLAKILSQRHGFRCTVLFSMSASGDGTIDPTNQMSLPGASALDAADGIVMLLRYRRWPDAAMRHFVNAYRRGVPIIALRTSTHAFNYPDHDAGEFKSFNRFGKDVLGEGWMSHWGRHKAEATRGVVEPSARHHPILRGVAKVFGDTDVYEAYPPADAEILLRGQVVNGMKPDDPPAEYRKKRSTDRQEQGINEPMMPIAWTRRHRNDAGNTNRVFCSTMGAATDLVCEDLRRLVVNAVYWGLELDVPERADVRFVVPFEPSAYGFDGYRRGLRPGDLALGRALPRR